ncbi:MAG: 2-oxoacid:acceptor oxidoreductase family protein [Coriobacteriia bacterium]|nr:2-oxoacid:acceptor oxidoreductase family protein [Coriobacteriia bacterium]
MSDLIEIRWHARAGQGAITASKLLAETALLKGKYIQAMPEYGPERTGAPLKAYTRISDVPIDVHNNIVKPTIVVVLDDTLLPVVDVLEGLDENGILLINTTKSIDQIRDELGVAPTIKIAVVDAKHIALDTIKRDMPNTPTVGALVQVAKMVTVEALKENLIIDFGKKFTQDVVDANLASVDRAAQEVVSQ